MTEQRALIEAHIRRWVADLPDTELYAPMAYLLDLPAKRLRPLLTVLGCELFGGRAVDVLDEAIALELFHNFTLMHDDIMDGSPLRRGRPAVHVRWGVNTAILSGDAMLVKAYQTMGADKNVLAIFNQYALAVCEGQDLDMRYEQRNDVSLAEYHTMIRLKTAVLLACALRIGACKAGASQAEQDLLGDLGENLGLAFQLRDDLLDAFGDSRVTGKQQGGDLRNGKRTWLLIRALERARSLGDPRLEEELRRPAVERSVMLMAGVITELGVRGEAEGEVERLESMSLGALSAIAVPETRKADLRALVEFLKGRSA